MASSVLVFHGYLVFFRNELNFNLIYLFVSRHEVHSMNTHTLQNPG